MRMKDRNRFQWLLGLTQRGDAIVTNICLCEYYARLHLKRDCLVRLDCHGSRSEYCCIWRGL
jgi:hypothetical protein